jgi:amino acid transporter
MNSSDRERQGGRPSASLGGAISQPQTIAEPQQSQPARHADSLHRHSLLGHPEAGDVTDAEYLAQFGYEQRLHRRLNLFSTFAAGFSYMSPTTGIFGLFALGLAAVGGALIWVWPIAFFGQLLVALVFAEVSTHYPLAGSVFQWTKYFSRSKAYAWFTGWIYLFAGVLTTAGVVATLPLVLIPMLDRLGIGIHLSDSLATQRTIALVSIAVYTLLNAVGVKVVALINNSAVVFEALGLLVFAVILALFHHHHGVEVYTDTGGAGFTGASVLVGLFVGLWVMYGFDTASTLAEESHDPRRNAPRSVIASVTAAFVTGGISSPRCCWQSRDPSSTRSAGRSRRWTSSRATCPTR